MGSITKSAALVAVGAAAAHLLDPISGRRRRAELAARTRSQISKRAAKLNAKARYEAGRAKGLIHETFIPEEPPRDELALLQKIRSEAVGPTKAKFDHVNIKVDGSKVHLVGVSLDRDREEELADRISKVTGVSEVRNELVPAS